MKTFEPRDPDFAERVRRNFARQAFMTHLGAQLSGIAPGQVSISMPWNTSLGQQHGYFHAGATSAIADSAAGYAAFTLFAAGNGVLTTEFKINLLAPANGQMLVARGEVIRPGRTLSVCRSDVFAISGGDETLVAAGMFTMIQVANPDE